ncbi:hypothetical protein C8F01DRAFT_1369148 [Mycena amicta]|nr:hypothetical protein C8F01DRAFT_1369148 [Mycena amicta]
MQASSTPPELWLEIFKNLPKASLSSAYKTSRTFSRLARPLLFAAVIFPVYGFDAWQSEELFLPARKELQNFLDRLQFLTSDEIAPLVRSCRIQTWRAVDKPNSRYAEEDALILLDAVLDRIGRFTKLRNLSIRGVNLHPASLSKIFHGPPQLRELELEWLYPSADPEPFTPPPNTGPPLTKFSIRMNQSEGDDLKPWIPFLNPSHLRELHLECDFRPWSGHPASDGIPVFPLVSRLSMLCPSGDVSVNDIAGILPKFPSVENLELTKYLSGDDEVGSLSAACAAILPTLRGVRVPHTCLGVFLPHAPCLTRLAINYITTAAELSAALDNLEVPNVTSLFIHLIQGPDDGPPDSTILNTISKCFPQLAHLRIDIAAFEQGTENSVATTFLESLIAPDARDVLPSGLTVLMLSWQFKSTHIYRTSTNSRATPIYRAAIDLPSLRDALIARYAGLTALWIDGASFFCKVRRLSSTGEVLQQVCEENYAHVEDRGAALENFWQSSA